MEYLTQTGLAKTFIIEYLESRPGKWAYRQDVIYAAKETAFFSEHAIKRAFTQLETVQSCRMNEFPSFTCWRLTN